MTRSCDHELTMLGVVRWLEIDFRLVVSRWLYFQTPSLPGEAPRRPCEGLAKAESTHNAPVLFLRRLCFLVLLPAFRRKRTSSGAKVLADAISKSLSSSSSSSASSSSDKDWNQHSKSRQHLSAEKMRRQPRRLLLKRKVSAKAPFAGKPIRRRRRESFSEGPCYYIAAKHPKKNNTYRILYILCSNFF